MDLKDQTLTNLISCIKCKQKLLAKDFYPAHLKEKYLVCRTCVDEKRKAHKENREPIYTNSVKIKEKNGTKVVKEEIYQIYDMASIDYGQVYVIGEDIEEPFTQPVKIRSEEHTSELQSH